MLPIVTGRSEFAAVIIRTDFSDETVWRAVCAESLRPWGDGDYEPHVHIVDDPVWVDATADDVIAAVSADEDLSVISSPTASPCGNTSTHCWPWRS
ncbi:hypothetical protein OG937_45545 [Streptomyces sp. NBC_00510]